MPKGLQGFQPGNTLGRQFQSKPKVHLICNHCEEEFEVQPWDAKRGRKYCSTSCRSRHTMKGKQHWNWQGGISNRWDTLHNSIEYQEWRLTVWQRDLFSCRHCGTQQSRANPLHAHHVKLKAKYPELILVVDNGITLCRNCHDVVHYGRPVHRGRHG